jgi:hypothetical protein
MAIGKYFKDLTTTTNINNLLGVGEKADGSPPGYKFTYSNDGTLASDSDAIVPTQKAIKTYANKAQENAEDYADGKFLPKGSYTLGNIPVTDKDGTLQVIDGILEGDNITIDTDVNTGAKTINATLDGTFLESNVALVDQINGDNDTGVIGDLSKPFKTYNKVTTLATLPSLNNGYNVKFAAGAYTEEQILLYPFINISGEGSNSTLLSVSLGVNSEFDNVSGTIEISDVRLSGTYLDLSALTTNNKSAAFLFNNCTCYSSFSVSGRAHLNPGDIPDTFEFNHCTIYNAEGLISDGLYIFNDCNGTPAGLSSVYENTNARLNNVFSTNFIIDSTISSNLKSATAIVINSLITNIVLKGTQAFLIIDATSLQNCNILYFDSATPSQVTLKDETSNIKGSLLELPDLGAIEGNTKIYELVVGQLMVAQDTGAVYRLVTIGNPPGTPHTVAQIGAGTIDGSGTIGEIAVFSGITTLTSTANTLPTTDEKAAMDGANSPSASNVFATMNDLAGTVVPESHEETSNPQSPYYYAGLAIATNGQTALSISQSPISEAATFVFWNGPLAVPGPTSDNTHNYTRSGANITWNNSGPGGALKTTDNITVHYNYLASGSIYEDTGDITISNWACTATDSVPSSKIRIIRIGKLVTLYLMNWGAIGKNGGASSISAPSGTIPTRFLPNILGGAVSGFACTYRNGFSGQTPIPLVGSGFSGLTTIDVDGTLTINMNAEGDVFNTFDNNSFGWSNCSIPWMIP